MRLLKEIVESGWGHRLLNYNIRHTTVSWTISSPNVLMAKVSGTQNRAYVGDARPTYISKGPTSPRKLLGLGDVEDFLRDLNRANGRPMVDVEPYTEREERPTRFYYHNVAIPRHTFIYEYRKNTRRNPEYHPEWLESVEAFLNTWESAAGDAGIVTQKYRMM